MKIFSNYIFRLTACFCIFAVSIFFPFSFVLPRLTGQDKIFFIVLMAVVATLEIILFVFFNYKIILKPLKSINDAQKKLIGGEYNSRIDLHFIDKEVKKIALNVNNIAGEFENLEQMRKSFVANASHELRSPLTSMQGFLQAVLDGTIDDDNRNKYLTIVLNETKRLSSLINSMLDLSRLESGKNPLKLVRFDINGLIKQVVERFEPNLVKKEIQLDVDFVREASYVFGDRDKIVQVLINLIDNAIKYSPAYSRILVTTHIHGRKLYISVKDKGYGISKKDQMLIWDRFYMADKARTPSKGKGTGLGLSIVRKIIEEHNEVIWVESNKGAGATFIFTLTLFDPNKHKSTNAEILKN